MTAPTPEFSAWVALHSPAEHLANARQLLELLDSAALCQAKFCPHCSQIRFYVDAMRERLNAVALLEEANQGASLVHSPTPTPGVAHDGTSAAPTQAPPLPASIYLALVREAAE